VITGSWFGDNVMNMLGTLYTGVLISP